MMNFIYLASGVVLGLVGLWFDYQRYRVLHSLLFILILMPLSIFVASSTGNALGQGLVCGLMGGLLGEMMLLRKFPDKFNAHFKSGAKPLTATEVQYGAIGFGVVTAIVIGITLL